MGLFDFLSAAKREEKLMKEKRERSVHRRGALSFFALISKPDLSNAAF